MDLTQLTQPGIGEHGQAVIFLNPIYFCCLPLCLLLIVSAVSAAGRSASHTKSPSSTNASAAIRRAGTDARSAMDKASDTYLDELRKIARK